MEPIIKLIDHKWEDLMAGVTGQKRTDFGLTLHRLKEALFRVDRRYREYRIAHEQMRPAEDGKLIGGRPSDELQLALVDKIEAFHQQVYATGSALVLTVNHRPVRTFKTDHPIDSIRRFLQFAREKSYDSTLSDALQWLERSEDFRAKFVDHPQQHLLHDWITYSHIGESYVIYFVRQPGELVNVYMVPPLDPIDPRFRPPVNYQSFYVSPNPSRTIAAVGTVVSTLLGLRSLKS